MRILFFDYGQYTGKVIIKALVNLGHEVFPFKCRFDNYDVDALAMTEVLKAANDNLCNCIFSANFVPFLSMVADVMQIPYVSWCEDSPVFTAWSPVAKSAYSHLFLMDRDELSRLVNVNDNANIGHTSLASDPDSFAKTIGAGTKRDYYDVSFIGNLYENTEFGRISFDQSNERFKGFLDGLIYSQAGLYGVNVLESALTDETARNILDAVGNDVPNGYLISEKQIAMYVLEKRISYIERVNYLKEIGDKYNLSVFSKSAKPAGVKASWNGFADYYYDMPVIFNHSKINLHFAPRNIHTGVSLRVFDVLACGGFLLTTFQSEICDLFSDGEELVMFSDKDDMCDKISYYLSHDEERNKIAHNGYEKVLNNYTYEKVLGKMLSTL